jgi:hypothetical protein
MGTMRIALLRNPVIQADREIGWKRGRKVESRVDVVWLRCEK